MPDEAGHATIRQAWTELWKLAPRFGSSAQEAAFLRGYCRQFANQRRPSDAIFSVVLPVMSTPSIMTVPAVGRMPARRQVARSGSRATV